MVKPHLDRRWGALGQGVRALSDLAAADGAAKGSRDTSFFGHPRGLAVLFFAEMWERFSFYGMRALLVLYLTQHFLFSDNESQGIYAAYASLVYLMPIVGGFIADRYLGPRKAVLIGAVFLVLGHFGMAFEGSGSRQFVTFDGQTTQVEAEGRDAGRRLFIEYEGALRSLQFETIGEGEAAGAYIQIVDDRGTPERSDDRVLKSIAPADYALEVEKEAPFVSILFLSLSLITVGVGFLKANISTIVGALYEQTDPRRDSGFTIFYMGINLGSVLATLLCGYLGAAYGWAYGFGLAGLGMLAGLITFIIGKPWLEGKGEPKRPVKFSWEAATWIGGAVALLPIYFLMRNDAIVSTLLTIGGPAIFIGVLIYALAAFKAEERSRMVVAILLTAFSVVFWMLFEQAGSSLTLYASRNSDLTIWGDIRMTAGQTNFFNPAIIVLLAPVFAWLWTGLEKRGLNPPVPVKFALGLVQVGLGFLVLVWGANAFAAEQEVDGKVLVLVPLIWLFLAYLLHTTGEIFLSPVGLSMITKLSAPKVVGLMMGVWFLSSSIAHTLAGFIAQTTSSETVGGVVVDSAKQLQTYTEVFWNIGLIGVGVGVLVLLLSPLLTRGMAGVK